MRIITTTLTLMLVALLTSSAWAEKGSERKGDRPSREEMRQKILDKFDADGDGQLNEDERAAAREEMRSRRGGKGKRGPEARRRGRGPQGKPEGRRGGPDGQRPPNPGAVFDRFDTNEDGQLSRSEFMELAREMRRMRERRGFDGPPPRGDRGPRGRRGPGGDFDEDRRPERPRRPRSDVDTSVDAPEMDETA